MCKHAVKKLPYLLRYVYNWYKTPQMCDKAILGNGGTFTSAPDCYKNWEVCNNAADNYPHALEFIYELQKTQENLW